MKLKGGKGGGIRLTLDDAEASLLRELVAEMQMMLEADIPQSDAVKQRLFPTAYEDPENEETFREMTATDLAGYIRSVKAQVRGIPVTYADVWE